MLLYVNYLAYERLVFIFGKIRLLAIEQHAFLMPSGEKISMYIYVAD